MAQLMPLPLTVSCFSKIQFGFAFLVPAHPGSPGKRAVKRVCVGKTVSHTKMDELIEVLFGTMDLGGTKEPYVRCMPGLFQKYLYDNPNLVIYCATVNVSPQ